MLASLRLTPVRHALVIFLMALCALIAVERAQAAINGVQHGLAIEHGPSALELASDDHEHDHDHAPPGDDDPAAVAATDQMPGPHHHHSEGPQIAALMSPTTLDVAVSRSDAVFIWADTGSPQSRIFGLDRPPKALSRHA